MWAWSPTPQKGLSSVESFCRAPSGKRRRFPLSPSCCSRGAVVTVQAHTKLHYPATQRNKDAIFDVLKRVLPTSGTVLEIASGSGEHVIHFAEGMPHLHWQPSSYEEQERNSIDAYVSESHLTNLSLSKDIDVTLPVWPVGDVDAILCINMIHISPWAATEGLFKGAVTILLSLGLLVTYGPYAFDGHFTSPSNAAFDERLKGRDKEWGVRDVRDLKKVATTHGFSLEETVEMPANNHILVWRKE